MPQELRYATVGAGGILHREELAEELQRLLASQCFIKSLRLQRFLKYVLGCIDRGEADQIREYLIAVEVFDRKPSFDQRVDPIVRVEASRLRSKLKTYYESEGKDDPVIIELPRGSYVPIVRRRAAPVQEDEPVCSWQPGPVPVSAPEARNSGPSARRSGWKGPLKWFAAGVALALVVGVTIGATLWFSRSYGQARAPLRASSETGVAAYPALSPDGKLLAYSSDREGEGHVSIWVQPLSGGEPIRLTHDPFDDREPSFSPDSSEIAFRSEKDGGGIYVVSVFGHSKPRLIVKRGYRPRYSPDGAWVLYSALDEDQGPGQIHVAPAHGGRASPLATARD